MAIEDNKALVRRFYAEIDAGNIDAMDELVAEDYIDHHPPPFPGLPGGREGLKETYPARCPPRAPRCARPRWPFSASRTEGSSSTGPTETISG